MSQRYPSDISREQFEKIKPILESRKKKTRPRLIDIYKVFCGVLYVLKSGCQWRILPKEFPRWENIYYYFQMWSKKKGKEPSLLVKKNWLRQNSGRKEKTSICIIDAQSVKNADTAERKGYDAGKKISGSYRS